MNRYTDALYKIHLDMHCPEWDPSILSQFDAGQIMDAIAGTGCRAMVAFAKDCYGNAYYNTRLGHRHACIGTRDLLGALLEEGRRHDVAVAAYFCVLWDNRACEEHPDWQLRGPDGEPVADSVSNGDVARWRSVCPNSGFAELMEQMVAEVARDYDVDAFHLDMFNLDFGGLSCYCETCARMFRDSTGQRLPAVANWDATWRRFLQFRYESTERYMRRLKAVAQTHKPGVPVVMNYHAAPGFDWRPGQLPVRHSLPSDMATGETYTPMFGDLYPGLSTRFLRGIAAERKAEVVSWRMNRITDFTTKPKEQLRWELLTSASLGANVMVIDQPFANGRLDEYSYRRVLSDVFAELDLKRPYLDGEPERHMGLYYSAKTRDHYGRSNQERFQSPLQGAYKAMIESHLNVDFLFDETAHLNHLQQYPAVLLPNVAAMSQDEVEMFAEYVWSGGTLIASMDTSLYDETGEPLADFQLADVFGVHNGGMHDCDTCYFRDFAGEFGADVDPDCFVLIHGPLRRVTPSTARGMGCLHEAFHRCRVPEQFFSHSMHPPHQRVQQGVYANTFGKGRCVYFSAGVDMAYAGHHELPEHRKLLARAAAFANYTPPVTVSAPLNVESIVTRQPSRYIVHLLAFNPIRQSVTLPNLNTPLRPSLRMEEPPLYRARININVPFTSARTFNNDSECRIDGSEVVLQCENVHEMVIIDL